MSDRGWFEYTNGDDTWVLDVLRRAVEVVGYAAPPAPGPECDYCAYVAGASGAG